MAGWLVRRTVRGSLTRIRYVTVDPPGTAPPAVRRVYAQLERDFGVLAPPVALHAPEPVALAATWMMLRETLLVPGRTDRASREVVAAAVSLGNTCPYCVDVHGSALHQLAPRGAAAITADRIDRVTDPDLRALAGWARTSGQRPATGPAPFTADRAAELIGVAVTFHYLNRMVNVFLDGSPLPSALPAGLHGTARRLFGWLMRPPSDQPCPGAALDLLPAAFPAADLDWAAGAPTIAAAFARAGAGVDRLAEDVLSRPVRDLVVRHVADWDGRPTGPSRSWAGAAVADLPGAWRPAARLALLTALASYQVDASVVDDFRRADPDDGRLVAVTAWASLTAARHLGARMWSSPAG